MPVINCFHLFEMRFCGAVIHAGDMEKRTTAKTLQLN
jgi:hypothetical protein